MSFRERINHYALSKQIMIMLTASLMILMIVVLFVISIIINHSKATSRQLIDNSLRLMGATIEYNINNMRSIIDYIDEHIKEKVTLKDAAKDIGISGAYLSTVFKKEMGQNLTEYINIRKVQMAKEMLRSGKLVYEVSELVGFENVTYFSKVFKKYTGISPDSFRKNNDI